MSVMFYIDRVWAAVRQAVKRVLLLPFAPAITMINVIAKCSHLVTSEKRALARKPGCGPIILIRYDLFYPHEVDEVTAPFTTSATGPDDVVAKRGHATNYRLAGRQRAEAEERVRRKAEVVLDDVTEKPHETQ